jgi:hypothetical protein
MTNKTPSADQENSVIEDLTVIHGIAKTRQEWLRASFHVRTLLDLANLSADEIEAKSKADGKIVSRGEIESWLERARQLTSARTGGGSREMTTRIVAQFVVYFHQYRDENDTVKYRTEVHHVEADKSATTEQAELRAWMMKELEKQIGQPIEPVVAPRTIPDLPEIRLPPEESPTATSERIQRLLAKVQGHSVPPVKTPTTQPTASSERYQRLLAKVQGQPAATFTQAPTTQPAASSERQQRLLARVGSADRPAPRPIAPPKPAAAREIGPSNVHVQVSKIELLPSSILQGNTPFTIQTRFELMGAMAETAAQMQSSAQFYAYQRATGIKIDLGSVEAFPEGQTTYTAALSGVRLAPGIYRLQAIIQVTGASGPGYGEIPFVQIV